MHTTTLRIVALSALLWAALAGACRSLGPRPLPSDPARALATVEDNLTGAVSVRCLSRLTAEGAIAAQLRCDHQLSPDGRVRVRVVGTFAGRPVDVVFASDGGKMSSSGAGQPRSAAAPEDLWEGLLIGMTRMGLMHNVALIAGGGVPDGCGGDVRRWLGAREVAAGEDLEVDGVRARALTFGVELDGQVVGSAVLWVAVENGLPLERWQRVPFPGGDLQVTEVYEHLEVNGPLSWTAATAPGQ